jgi:hypothetical protein
MKLTRIEIQGSRTLERDEPSARPSHAPGWKLEHNQPHASAGRERADSWTYGVPTKA